VPIPPFIQALREKIGHDPLWLLGVTAVVVRGDEVLLVRRSDNGHWSPVTGIVDPGEHPAVTAAREVIEETGVTCTVEALVSVSVTEPVVHANGDRAQYVDHTFLCRYADGEPYPADDESTHAGWVSLGDLPAMKPAYLQRIEEAVRHPPGGPTLLRA
jgi:ADP-ribose pyrophosphatase YjhB (NUDIX family)